MLRDSLTVTVGNLCILSPLLHVEKQEREFLHFGDLRHPRILLDAPAPKPNFVPGEEESGISTLPMAYQMSVSLSPSSHMLSFWHLNTNDLWDIVSSMNLCFRGSKLLRSTFSSPERIGVPSGSDMVQWRAAGTAKR